MRCRFP